MTSFVPPDVKRVYNMLTPRPKELINNSAHRKYLREGEIDVWNAKERRKKQRYFFLFNDVLLLCKREGRNAFWLKVFISLRTSLKIEDVPDSQHPQKVEFRLYAPKKTFILFARTPEEKHGWIRDIRACCQGDFGNDTNVQFGETPLETKDLKTQVKLSGDIGKIEIPGIGGGEKYRADPHDEPVEITNPYAGGGATQYQTAPVGQYVTAPSGAHYQTAPATQSAGSGYNIEDEFAQLALGRVGGNQPVPAAAPVQSQPQQPSEIDDPFGLLTIGTMK